MDTKVLVRDDDTHKWLLEVQLRGADQLFPHENDENQLFRLNCLGIPFQPTVVAFHCDRWKHGGPYFCKSVAVDRRQVPDDRIGEAVAEAFDALQELPWSETGLFMQQACDFVDLSHKEWA